VATPTSCQFNGQYVPDGVSITTYLASAVPYGALCNPQLRTCSNGVLSGSFPAATCTAAAAASCKYGTSTIANGDSVQAFTTNVVPYGQSCTSAQTSITCNNGVFAFADGTSATSNYYPSCLPASTTTCQFGGKTLQTGDSVIGYLKTVVPVDQTCALITATCNGGVISGLPKTATPSSAPRTPGADPNSSVALYPTCYVGGCTYSGKPVANQTTVTAYSKSLVGFSQSCTSVQTALTCNNGTLSDSSGKPLANFYGTCGTATKSSCSFLNYADSTTINIASGQTVTGYSSTSVLEGNTCASVQKNVSCNDGIMSINGVELTSAAIPVTYLYSSCNVGACTITKQSVLNGASVTAYASSYVGYGQSCSSVQATLTCRNSTLFNATGAAYSYTTTCAPVTTPNCIVDDFANGFADINIPNGQAITGYTRKTGGTTCPNYKVTLSCSNGLISENGGAATSPNSGIFYSTCQ
jgi:hypothetical protein